MGPSGCVLIIWALYTIISFSNKITHQMTYTFFIINFIIFYNIQTKSKTIINFQFILEQLNCELCPYAMKEYL